MKYIFLFILLGVVKALYAQNPDWEVIKFDSVLSCKFPGPVSSSHTDTSAAYEYDAGYIAYKINKDPTPVIDKSKAGFDSTIQSYERIAVNSMPYKFTHRSIDTIIGGTKGVFIQFYDPPLEAPFKKLNIFFTVKDSFTYTIYSLVRTDSTDNEKKINWFYSNLKFTKNYYEALPDHEFTKGQFWVKILMYLVVLTALGLLAGSFFKKKISP